MTRSNQETKQRTKVKRERDLEIQNYNITLIENNKCMNTMPKGSL